MVVGGMFDVWRGELTFSSSAVLICRRSDKDDVELDKGGTKLPALADDPFPDGKRVRDPCLSIGCGRCLVSVSWAYVAPEI